MKIAIDIDGVITRIPEFLALTSKALMKEGHHITILTSRTNSKESITKSIKEIKDAQVSFNDYYFLPETNTRSKTEFPSELNWFQQYIWQKAEYCKNNKIDIFFEDDPRTVALVLKYAPDTVCLRVC